MASSNFIYGRVFASLIAETALYLACRYLSAASGDPQAKKCLLEVLLQPDDIPYHLCPAVGLGIAATRGTDYLAATAAASTIEVQNMVHSGSMSSGLSWDMVEALLEVGVEVPSDRRLCQAFSADSHNMLRSAGSL